MIQDVKIKELKVLKDRRGFLMEMLRSDEAIFHKFGQVYLTMVKKNIAKAWHYHKKQDDYFICVLGQALVVLYDQRKSSPTFAKIHEFILTEPGKTGKRFLLKIPKGVVHGFCCYQGKETRIINIPNQLYHYQKPDEYRYAWNDPKIPYHWPKNIKDGG